MEKTFKNYFAVAIASVVLLTIFTLLIAISCGDISEITVNVFTLNITKP